MIRIDFIELLHWDIQPQQKLPLARAVTMLSGENGSGKTSILDAIRVALGAKTLGSDRSIEAYLLKQARPVAMVRIVADNSRQPQGQRPFDPLGEFVGNQVTLAVVFQAEEENTYRREYYMLDGDTVPLDCPDKRCLQVTDYRARLRKVGIGDQYTKLLCMPQGEIAKLCEKNGRDLFGTLFDVIGGRQALDAWEGCLAELRAEQELQADARKTQGRAEERLELLRKLTARHHEYVSATRRDELLRQALPHARVKEARAQRTAVHECVRDLEAEIGRLGELITGDESLATQMDEDAKQIQAVRAADLKRHNEVDEVHGQTIIKHAEALARLTQLRKIREKAEGLEALDLAEANEALQGWRLRSASNSLEIRQATLELQDVANKVEQLGKGLRSLPDEVLEFRAQLLKEGIPHYILAEIIEVQDDAWRPALEGYLGRLRFAVVVNEPDDWKRAAELARGSHYPYGVLVPDVRSASPADNEGLVTKLRVHEPRCRPLVARLLRHIQPAEPPFPLLPPRKEAFLAQDGFFLDRTEARVAFTEQYFLGRYAIEAQKQALLVRKTTLTNLLPTLEDDSQEIQRQIGKLAEAIALEGIRQEWEQLRDEFGDVTLEEDRLSRESKELKRQRTELRRADLAHEKQERDCEKRATEARTRADGFREKKGEKTDDLGKKIQEKDAIDTRFGELLAQDLPAYIDEIAEIEAEYGSVKALEAHLAAHRKILEAYSSDEMDTMLPRNYERQIEEVASVEGQLKGLELRIHDLQSAASKARQHYHETTVRVFRAFFGRLKVAARSMDFHVSGRLETPDDGKFACEIRVGVGDKPPVHYGSSDLSGGQKAAFSILMSMTAVALESEGAGFFLIDEPFSQSDLTKINELGEFLARSGAQYLISMPTSSDLEHCGDWMSATWTASKSTGGKALDGTPVLAPLVKLSFRNDARG